jgi:hypothetical protein
LTALFSPAGKHGKQPGLGQRHAVLVKAKKALEAVTRKMQQTPAVQGREFIDLGIQVHDAIASIDRTLEQK